jgi:hypothetical protein
MLGMHMNLMRAELVHSKQRDGRDEQVLRLRQSVIVSDTSMVAMRSPRADHMQEHLAQPHVTARRNSKATHW